MNNNEKLLGFVFEVAIHENKMNDAKKIVDDNTGHYTNVIEDDDGFGYLEIHTESDTSNIDDVEELFILNNIPYTIWTITPVNSPITFN